MTCEATMVGMEDETHTHTCSGGHDAGYHWCPDCQRWWWKS